MAEGLFALSIRSRCELGGRGDKNRAREVSETAGERWRQGQKDGDTVISVRDEQRGEDDGFVFLCFSSSSCSLRQKHKPL